jgi:hypothetical protein
LVPNSRVWARYRQNENGSRAMLAAIGHDYRAWSRIRFSVIVL